MNLLLSNRAQLPKGNFQYFHKTIQSALANYEEIDIAVGYISRDAIALLIGLIKENPGHKSVNLYIGMSLTRNNRKIALELNAILLELGLGRVYETRNPFHGKLYLFKEKNNPALASVGSSNLSGISNAHENHEIDLLIEDEITLRGCEKIFSDLIVPMAIPLEEIKGEDPSQPDPESDSENWILGERYPGLIKEIRDEEVKKVQSLINPNDTFVHRLKTYEEAPKSNINAYHAKGRLSRPRGKPEYILPRPWYEVAFILSKNEREDPKAPPDRFEVITDDGYTFEMRRAGDNNKNLESVGNLRVLGRWFKGRLEDADVLKLTEKITEETLALYGKRTIELTPIQDGSDRWYMNFAPDSEQ